MYYTAILPEVLVLSLEFRHTVLVAAAFCGWWNVLALMAVNVSAVSIMILTTCSVSY